MIVGPLFAEDQDHDLRRAQQEAIGRAVAILLSEGKQRWTDAETLLDVKTPLGIAIRTLPPMLDLIDDGAEYLAAIWRVRHRRFHARLELAPADGPQASMKAWLDWLSGWVRNECPPGVLRAMLSCIHEPDERSLPQHGYLVQWLGDVLVRDLKNVRAAMSGEESADSKLLPFDSADCLDSEEAIEAYLGDARKDGADAFANALVGVARARFTNSKKPRPPPLRG